MTIKDHIGDEPSPYLAARWPVFRPTEVDRMPNQPHTLGATSRAAPCPVRRCPVPWWRHWHWRTIPATREGRNTERRIDGRIARPSDRDGGDADRPAPAAGGMDSRERIWDAVLR